MDMKLDVSPAALAEIAKVGFDPVFGARPLKRAIQQRIENPLAKLMLEGTLRAEGRDPGGLRRRRVRVRARRALTLAQKTKSPPVGGLFVWTAVSSGG